MKRSCFNCQYCEVGYEHSKVCILNERLIFNPEETAINCGSFKEYNRWDNDET